ncbi:hypothetical protein [Bifidobacterium cuniculi]|uniref:Large tegument protein n=1 Tax=Bifidobacterium cuniculi TaxID=1688 RepID=A0A087AM01_9BIFI|nr:hypothetical protein [Bifidobacterium cuniculi]KFI59801.1 large tegument protein [Bifidobacterium cuniculi]
MNPNETPTGAPQMPPRPQRPTPQMPPRPQQPQQPAMPPQQPAGVDAVQGVNNFADNMGHGHVKMGNYKVDYASIVTVVGAVLAIISVFIPFFSSRWGGSASLMATFGFVGGSGVPWLILLSSVAIGVLAVLRRTEAALTATIYTTLVALFMILGAARTLVATGGISYSFGMYLMIIALIVMLVGTITSQYNAMRAEKGTFTPLDTTPQPAAQYADNGWQFGVPAPGAPSSADRSNWQFGVPNAPTAAADGMPPMPQAPQYPAQPAAGTFPVQQAPMPQQTQSSQSVSYSQQTQYTAATPQASVTVESEQQGAIPFQQSDIPPIGGDAASDEGKQQ